MDMPQDVLTLSALVNELSAFLVGGRIDRVTQPEKDEVFLHIRAKGVNRLLVISVNPNAPRMHLATVKKDNPYAAPAFLMHLRKHLGGGIIQGFAVQNCDRIVCMSVLGRNELYDSVSVRLYIELMGRYSNIIAVDQQGYITDALRHIPPDENQLRAILPHLPYELPPMTKIKPDDRQAIDAYLAVYREGDLSKYLFGGIAGIVNISARELVARSGLGEHKGPLDDEMRARLQEQIALAFAINDTQAYRPCYSVQDGEPHDYYIYPYATTGCEMVPCATLNEAAEACATAKDRVLRLKENGKPIGLAIRNAIKKQEKALALAQQKLLDCQDCDKWQLYGELLTCNLYRLSRGMDAALVDNYYTGQEITIPLDITKTPSENAQAYYRKYAKQKRTIEVATKQVEQYNQVLEYLQSVEYAYGACTNSADLAEIREELQQSGFLKAPQTKGKVRKPLPVPPMRFSVQNATVLLGRNNTQNETLTFHTARENDLWLHVKGAHGSHVVIQADTLLPQVVQIAAEIAAAYSEQAQGDKIAVDYTLRKYVKRHPSKQKGMVIYTDYKTITVNPNKHNEYQTNR